MNRTRFAVLVSLIFMPVLVPVALRTWAQKNQCKDSPERLTVFLIPVGPWSDGTAAPADAH